MHLRATSRDAFQKGMREAGRAGCRLNVPGAGDVRGKRWVPGRGIVTPQLFLRSSRDVSHVNDGPIGGWMVREMTCL